MNTQYNIEFVTKTGSAEDVFKIMKEAQKLGVADKHARIIFNGIKVAAGYFDDFYGYFDMYNATLQGEEKQIVSALPDLEGQNATDEYIDILNVCSSELETHGKGALTPEFICSAVYEKTLKQYRKSLKIDDIKR